MLRLIIIYVTFVQLLSAVDRSNFKKCDQSAFCKIVRKQKPLDRVYNVIPESVTVQSTFVQMNLRRRGRSELFLAEVSGLIDNKLRLKVKPLSKTARRRYEIPVSDVLISDPVGHNIEVEERSSSRLVIGTSESCKVVINMSPFILDVLCSNELIISINSRSLFRFDLGHIKSKGYVRSFLSWMKSFILSDDDTDSSYDEQPAETDLPDKEETFKTHVDTKPNGATSVGVDISFPGFEFVYGIPEHADSLALKSTTNVDPYRLYNLDVFEYEVYNGMALYGSVPYLISHSDLRTVGVFWHNAAETWVDVNRRSKPSLDTLSRLSDFMAHADPNSAQVDTHWFSESGVIDVFLLLGPTPQDLFRQYSQLTGTTPLPPLFSLGYHQSRWNYNSEQDIADVNARFDEHNIPMDVLWLDIEHTHGKRYFTWDSTSFPHPAEMIANVSAFGRKMVTIIDPHIRRDDGYFVYSEASSNNYLVLKNDGSVYEGWCWPGASVWLDFVNPEVRKFWAKKFHYSEYLGSTPDLFTWNDMNEPSVFNGPEITMHKDAVHYGGWEHRDLHNVYGLYVHRASVEGQVLRSNKSHRPFVLSRAFFAGSQRYGAVWTGDNTGEWDHLMISIPMVLSLNLVGITFSGADIGGFFKNPDAELLTRWYQAGAFQPFFRAHAHLDTRRREPWLLPAENLVAVRAAIIKRYRLLPYWYTLFRNCAESGAPVMRPLWVEFPQDKSTFAIDNEHTVGSALLVRPVTQSRATSVTVFLPDASQIWYDFDTYKAHIGGRNINVSVDINKIPVYIRGGYILPVRDRIRRSSTLVPDDPYTLIIALNKERLSVCYTVNLTLFRYRLPPYMANELYHIIRICMVSLKRQCYEGNAGGQLYQDDFHSFRYQSGEFILRQFNFTNGRSLTSRNLDPQSNLETKAWIERIVVIGLKSAPHRIILTVQDEEPIDLISSYSKNSGVLVIRNPGVNIKKDFVITFT